MSSGHGDHRDGLKPCREQFDEWWVDYVEQEQLTDGLWMTPGDIRCYIRDGYEAAWNRRSGEGELVKTITDSMFDDPGALDDCLGRCRRVLGEKKALLDGVRKLRDEYEYAAKQEDVCNQRPQLAGVYFDIAAALAALLDERVSTPEEVALDVIADPLNFVATLPDDGKEGK